MTAAGGLAVGPGAPAGRPRLLLALASVAVAFAAADTYVVVLALPDMMASVGLSIDELQRAAPIVSGFLLGYVAVLPLIGRIADLRGRLPVLVGSLVVFALGSLVTAAAFDLPSMVVGRFLQGVGGGGLVPATLALVADIYPANRRGVPLGVVGAVQEAGSVVGPLYGAVVLAVTDWRVIFMINLTVGVGLAVALAALRTERSDTEGRRSVDWVGAALAALLLVALVLVMTEPNVLAADVTLGLGFVPVVGASRWLSPVALGFFALAALFAARCLLAKDPLVDVRRWREVARSADLLGALLMAVALAGIILAFATADPQVSVFSPAGPWLLAMSALAGAGFWWRNRRTSTPLVPPGAFRRTPAWGALVVSVLVGAALIAALVDIPIFARVTVYPNSQLLAALVLVRFLVALPGGALLGGALIRWTPPGIVTAVGMLLAAGGFLIMSHWGLHTLHSGWASVPLIGAGLGFGLALAPVNATLLAATDAAVHGVSSALLVVARMVGMLVGISALTTLGLRRYYAQQVRLPAPSAVCPGNTQCQAYTDLLKEAGLSQLATVFVGAAVCALLAAVVAAAAFRTVRTSGVSTAAAQR